MAHSVAGVIAQVARREHAPPCARPHATAGVQREHVKRHRITGLQRTAQLFKLVGVRVNFG